MPWMAGDGGRRRRDKRARPGARELLRGALVGGEDPWLPWWLPLPGLMLALAWAAYEGVGGGGGARFLSALLWPGAALFLLATLAAFFGWQLDLD